MTRKNSFSLANQIIKEATRVGFQWKGLSGPLKKVREELREMEQEIKSRRRSKTSISDELGDLLFSLCNLASLLRIDPEKALHSTLDRFEARFHIVKSELKKKGKTPEESTLKEMDALWEKAKIKLKKKNRS